MWGVALDCLQCKSTIYLKLDEEQGREEKRRTGEERKEKSRELTGIAGARNAFAEYCALSRKRCSANAGNKLHSDEEFQTIVG
jgi:hypothetical protein